MAPTADSAPPQPEAPQPGPWSLLYTGACAGRESEAIRITELDDSAIQFDDYHLLRDESGEYRGSANFIASMPVDGREIGYVITYALRANDTGGFSGTQTVVEGGGHGLDCQVALLSIGED